MRLATAEQMRHIDSVAMHEYAVPGIVLMENAGRHVEGIVAALAAEIGPGTRVLVIAGKGNNGGDGFVVARHLRNRGIDVRVCLLPRGTELVGDAALNYEMAVKLGVPIVEPADAETISAQLDRTDIVVDAILGTGIHGEVTGPARVAIETLQDFAGLIVSVDIPSGIEADTGAVCGAAVRADITVTFGLAKIGLCQPPGSGHAGQVEVVDISLPRPLLESDGLRSFLTESADAEAKLPPRWGSMHKGNAGRAFIIAGSEGMTGAAAMSSEAAHRSGAGLVTVGVPRSLNDILECKVTEVMSLALPETEARCFSRAALEPALRFANGCEVVAIGPGLGTHPETRAFVREFVRDYEKPLVIDADGINAFAAAMDGTAAGTGGDVVGPSLIAVRDAATVITPHPGELARLFAGAPSAPHWAGSIQAIQANRLEAAREAASHLDSIVVLKGAGTVIADPSGQVWINPTGNEGMAKGGSGDVLTGIIAGLLAGGATPLDAAVAGVYYHGLAGDLAAAELGGRGMIAGDILRFLPKAWPRG